MAEPAECKRRLFVGIALDEQARARCAAVVEYLRRTGFDARYEAPEKLHVTLAFLGFVEPSRYAEVAAALAAPAAAAPFSVSLDRVGAFPNERRPRVTFIGARAQGADFRALAGNVRTAYAALGFAFKDDAVAHVTIARVKAPRRPLPSIDLVPIPVRVERLTLFESLPDPARNTSRYEIAATAQLG